jgi:hypothetical protein
MPHAPPISFFSILSPEQYWGSSTKNILVKEIIITRPNKNRQIEHKEQETVLGFMQLNCCVCLVLVTVAHTVQYPFGLASGMWKWVGGRPTPQT